MSGFGLREFSLSTGHNVWNLGLFSTSAYGWIRGLMKYEFTFFGIVLSLYALCWFPYAFLRFLAPRVLKDVIDGFKEDAYGDEPEEEHVWIFIWPVKKVVMNHIGKVIPPLCGTLER
jgi:hypothetical protein